MIFQVIDIVFAVLILLFIMRGFTKGLMGEIFSIAAVVLGLIIGVRYSKQLGVALRGYMTGTESFPAAEAIPNIAAFILLFIGVFIAVKIIEGILRSIFGRIPLGGIDKILGAILGLAEGLIIVGFVIFIIKMMPFLDSAALLADSIFARLFTLLTESGARIKPDVTTTFILYFPRMAVNV